MVIIAENGCATRCTYKEEKIYINTQMCEDYIFLAILHEIGHLITSDMTDTCMVREVLAWDWVKDHMGDFPLDKYESIRNERILRRMDIILEGLNY